MISPRPLHACSIAYLSFKRDGGQKGCQSLSLPERHQRRSWRRGWLTARGRGIREHDALLRQISLSGSREPSEVAEEGSGGIFVGWASATALDAPQRVTMAKIRPARANVEKTVLFLLPIRRDSFAAFGNRDSFGAFGSVAVPSLDGQAAMAKTDPVAPGIGNDAAEKPTGGGSRLRTDEGDGAALANGYRAMAWPPAAANQSRPPKPR
jgi:hypothetical protein